MIPESDVFCGMSIAEVHIYAFGKVIQLHPVTADENEWKRVRIDTVI